MDTTGRGTGVWALNTVGIERTAVKGRVVKYVLFVLCIDLNLVFMEFPDNDCIN